MPRMDKIGTHCTSVATDRDNVTRVTYHSTVVVEFNQRTGVTRLDSGGWPTVTTKNRMNQAARELGLSYNVYQKDHTWYVQSQGITHEFFDGIKIYTRTGLQVK